MTDGKAFLQLQAVRKVFDDGTVAVDLLDLEVDEGSFLCLLGPSGCGKTTTLRMVAGLESPTSGDIYLRGQRITDWPPQRRRVGMVFQNYALFQHMTVYDNLAFGLQVRRLPKGRVRERVLTMARQLDLADVLGVRVRRLDLSTMQRVAVARTLLAEPELLLLDEPLNNFQAGLREQMRAQLKTWQYQFGRTMIYVTHDQEEALTLGDRIAVMRDGRLEQVGQPVEVYRHPATLFVAGFIGLPPMNLLPARLDRATWHLVIPGAQVEIDPRPLPVDGLREQLVVGIRPERLVPSGEGPDGRPRARGVVELVRPAAARTILDVKLEGGATVRTVVPSPSGARPGDVLTLAFHPKDVVLFDPLTERRVG